MVVRENELLVLEKFKQFGEDSRQIGGTLTSTLTLTLTLTLTEK